ncbi:MAG: hypothetical protein WCO84_04565 [bacterium]
MKLNSFAVKELKVRFPFLAEWNPAKLNSASWSVTFKSGGEFPVDEKWQVERDGIYAKGILKVLISDGVSLKTVEIPEGETSPDDILDENSTHVVVVSACEDPEEGIVYTLFDCRKAVSEFKTAAKKTVNELK